MISNVMRDTLESILWYMRKGGSQLVLVTYFDSYIDHVVQDAWEEQRSIGQYYTLEGHMSKKCETAQDLYYRNNVSTRGAKQYTQNGWMEAMVTTFLNFTLSLWNERCEVLDGLEEEQALSKKKAKVFEKFRASYNSKDKVMETYKYLFDGEIGKHCQ